MAQGLRWAGSQRVIDCFILARATASCRESTVGPLPAEHYFVEFSVDTMLESDMAHAFLTSSNKDM